MRSHALDLGGSDAAARLGPIVDGASAVVRLAWAIQPVHDPAVLYRTNVEGTRNVLRAVRAAGVLHPVHASTLGGYAPSVGREPVDESHPDSGHATSVYSRHKITVERLLDRFERERPDLTVTRFRPTPVVQRAAATEIADLFLGRFVPRALRRGLVPLLPLPAGLSLQFVHADDVGLAVARMLQPRAGVPVSTGFDVATRTPLPDSGRAAADLGWTPRHTSAEVARELLDGMTDGATGATAALGGAIPHVGAA